MRKFKNSKGFTLIELVIVIVILGILAAVAIPKFVDLRGEAQLASAKGNLGGLRAAASLYYADTARGGGDPVFPPSTTELEAFLVDPLEWSGTYGYTYNSSTGAVTGNW